MVNLDVNLPQNGIIWVGKLSWGIVFIALFDVGSPQMYAVPSGSQD